MRYVIYGAGAIGCCIGAELSRAGHQVVLIARGEQLDTLQQNGLAYHSRDGEQRLTMTAVGHPAEAAITGDDCVILCVKSQHTLAALNDLAQSAPAHTTLVCAQNGIDNERIALRFFENVYGMVVRVAAMYVAPGEVSNPAFPAAGILDLGRYPSGLGAQAARIARDLEQAGFSSHAVGDIMRLKYTKLLQNTATAIEAAFAPSEHRTTLVKLARSEAEACLAAAQIDFAGAEEWAARRQLVSEYDPKTDPARPGGSSWQSLARQTGSIEVDYLNGEIAFLGRLHGFPTPVNSAIQELLRDLAAHRAVPGQINAGDFALQRGLFAASQGQEGLS